MRWLLALVLLNLPCRGQVSSGSLIGDIRDEAARYVPDVRITARHEATGFTRSTNTGASGGYRMDDLLPGAYSVIAERAGFRTITATSIVIALSEKTRLDFELKVASQPEAVTVTAHASPLQTDEASEGYLLESNFVRALPLSDRNIISLVTLGPGAIPRQLGGFVHDFISD